MTTLQRVTLSPDETLVTKVKVNLSTQADEVNVKPLGSITRTLPVDVDLDRVEMTPRLFMKAWTPRWRRARCWVLW